MARRNSQIGALLLGGTPHSRVVTAWDCEIGVALWLGFEPDDIRSWFAAAGLDDPDIEIREPSSGGRELPATFIASARKRPS